MADGGADEYLAAISGSGKDDYFGDDLTEARFAAIEGLPPSLETKDRQATKVTLAEMRKRIAAQQAAIMAGLQKQPPTPPS